MVREKIESTYDLVENKVLDTTALAMAKGTTAVRKISAKKWGKLVLTLGTVAIMAGAMAVTAFADDGGAGEIMNSIITTIKDYAGKIGVVVVVFGGVNAGLGVANQDDAGRNRGFMTMAGGAILIAVTALLKDSV